MAAPTPTIIVLERGGGLDGAALAIGAFVGLPLLGIGGVVVYKALYGGAFDVHATRDGKDQADAKVYVNGTLAGQTAGPGLFTVHGAPGSYVDVDVVWTDPAGNRWIAIARGVLLEDPTWLRQGPDDMWPDHPWKVIYYRLFPKNPVLNAELVNVGQAGTNGFKFRARDRGNINGPFAGTYLADVKFKLEGPQGFTPLELTSDKDGYFGARDLLVGKYRLTVVDSSKIPHEYKEGTTFRLLTHMKFMWLGAPVTTLEYTIDKDDYLLPEVILAEEATTIEGGGNVDLTLHLRVTPVGREYLVQVFDKGRGTKVGGGLTTNSNLDLTFKGDEGATYRVEAVAKDADLSGTGEVIFFPQDQRSKSLTVEATDTVQLTVNVTVQYLAGATVQEANVFAKDDRGVQLFASGTTKDYKITLTWMGARRTYFVGALSKDGKYSQGYFAHFDPFKPGAQVRNVTLTLVEGGGRPPGGGDGKPGPPPVPTFVPYVRDAQGVLHLAWR